MGTDRPEITPTRLVEPSRTSVSEQGVSEPW